MLPIQVLLLNLMSDFPMISIAADSVDETEFEQPRGYQVVELTAVAIVLAQFPRCSISRFSATSSDSTIQPFCRRCGSWGAS